MKKLFALCLLLLHSAFSSADSELLPADQAFAFQARVVNDQIELNWDIAKGYYLYKEKIKITSDASERLGIAKFPEAKIKDDEFFGRVGIYRDKASVSIPVLPGEGKSILLNVGFQGCADLGVCYPPVTKSVVLDISNIHPASAMDQAFNMFDQVKAQAQSVAEKIAPISDEPLPGDEAFKFSVEALNANTLVATWDVHPEYYLYHDKFFIDVKGAEFGEIAFPAGKIKDDPLFGKVQIHKGKLVIELPLENIQSQQISFSAKYQGCWTGGICYPPMEKTVDITLPIQDAPKAVSAATPSTNAPVSKADTSINTAPAAQDLNETDQIAELLKQEDVMWTLLSFFGFGLLLALTPCVFPMIPILSGIIVGQKDVTTRKAFVMSVVFVLAMSLTYSAAGVAAGYFGENLQVLFQTPWVLALFSAVFVALAMSMFGYYEIQLPASLQTKVTNISNKQEGGHLFSVAIMGFLSALIVGPCVAPPLAGALIYIGQTGDAVLGGLSLFVMSLGMGVPLIIIGAGVSKLPRAGMWMDNIKYIFGILMLAVAIWLIDRVIPPMVSLTLWALLFTISPIAMGVFNNFGKTESAWGRIFKAIGLIVLGYGILLWGLVARGGGDMLAPLSHWGASSTQVESAHVNFQNVSSVEALEGILASAKQNKQLVMLDFYADWCISCKELEKFVFSDPTVVKQLEGAISLQADVTENNANDKALMAKFGIIGPPAILFFKEGQEVRSARVVGEINAQAFIERLKPLQ